MIHPPSLTGRWWGKPFGEEMWHIFETKRGCDLGQSLCGRHELTRAHEPSIDEAVDYREIEDCEPCARIAGLIETVVVQTDPTIRAIADGGWGDVR